ncbi:unnamed protein product, partial [Phaeothamnion confervicola]
LSAFFFINTILAMQQCMSAKATATPLEVKLSACEVTHVQWTFNGSMVIERDSETLDIILVMDESGSIEFPRFCPQGQCYEMEKDFAKAIVKLLDRNVNLFGNGGRAGFVEFSDITSTDPSEHSMGVTGSRETFDRRVDALTYAGGRTGIGTGIDEATTLLMAVEDHKTHHQIMVVITDGAENENTDPVGRAIFARSRGIEVYAVGVGDAVDAAAMLNITGGLPERYFQVDQLEALDEVLVDKLVTVIEMPCSSGGALALRVTAGAVSNAIVSAGAVAYNKSTGFLWWDLPTLAGESAVTLDYDVNGCSCANAGVSVTDGGFSGTASGKGGTVSLHSAGTFRDDRGNEPDLSAGLELELRVNDDVPPVLACSAGPLAATLRNCLENSVRLTMEPPPATDNCDWTAVRQTSGPSVNGGLFPKGASALMFEASDAAGNAAETCALEVDVTDPLQGTGCPTPAPTWSPGLFANASAILSGSIEIQLPSATSCDGIDLASVQGLLSVG